MVEAFGDPPEDFDVERGSDTAVPIIRIRRHQLFPLSVYKPHLGRLGYPGNNLTVIEREDERDRIGDVRVNYSRGFREVRN